jgi:hypothetical protein
VLGDPIVGTALRNTVSKLGADDSELFHARLAALE